MVEKNFGLFFYLKQPKSKKDKGLKFIFLRITVDGQSVEISAKRLWPSAKWNKTQGRAIGNTEESKVLNAELSALETRVYVAKTYLLNRNIEITANGIKEILLGNTDDRRMVISLFVGHNKKVEELVGKDYAPATLTRFNTSLSHTRDFIRFKYGKDDLCIKELDYDFISDYFHWLKSVRNCSQNTALKYIGNFKKIVIGCVKRGWLNKDPFIDFSESKKPVNREALTQIELERLAFKKFTSDRLSNVRDIFLFSCYTGLAYIDVKNLHQENLQEVENGKIWIITERTKTRTAVRLPILPVAKEIIERYSDNQLVQQTKCVIPIPSNQKVNEYLKEIAALYIKI